MKKEILLCLLFFYSLQFCYSQAGERDSSFGDRGIVSTDAGKSTKNASVPKKILLQLDGSMFEVFISGNSTLTFNQGYTFITKRHRDGSADTTYGHKGFTSGVDLSATDAAMQPDGKIVIVGTNLFSLRSTMARYNTDGSPDSSFSQDGKLQGISAASVTLQTDGKIVVAGGWTVARYNTDGSTDSTFGDNGLVLTGFYTNAVAIQKDGKLVVAGYTYGSSLSMALARYNTDGSTDSSFAKSGKYTNAENPTSDEATSVTIESDGKIVAGGGSTEFTLTDYLFDISVWRFNTNGTPDSSFSGDGKQSTGFNYGYSSFASAVVQSDGKIVSVSATTIARFNTNGSLDKSFFKDGKQYSDLITHSVAIQSDGKIIFDGRTTEGDITFNLVRLNTDGSADKTFGKNGVLEDQLRKGDTEFKSIAIQKDGKAVAAGRTWNGKDYDFVVARYNLDGSPDSSFSGDGIQTTDFGASSDYANSVVIQRDGKIVVAGYSGPNSDETNFAVARYNTDGSPDNTFSADGKLITDFGAQDMATSAVIQSDGKIVVAGNTGIYQHNDFAIARYNIDGTLDNTFSGDGKKTSDYRLKNDKATSAAIQNDGKIVVAGFSGYGIKTDFAVFRYNNNGSLDKTFGDDGIQINGFGSVINSIAIQPDGKIVAAGDVTQRPFYNPVFGIVRFNENGSLDSTFSDDGKQTTATGGAASIAVEANGKIIVCGNNPYGNSYITRSKPDGSPDSSFSQEQQITLALKLLLLR